jgi:uncharacterized protein YndB with AHSA1/START domain
VTVVATTRAELAVPAEAAWAALADVSARPQWHPGLELARLDGPLAVGTRGRLKPRGIRAVELVVEVLAPGRRLALRGVHGLPVATGHYEHEVEPLGDGRCAVTLRMRVDGPLGPLIGRLASRTLGAWAQPAPLERLEALARDRQGSPSSTSS